MHPEAGLSCTACHGGNGDASSKEGAHPKAPAQRGDDERVEPRDRNLAWVQFRNPMDLRVAEKVCSGCHESAVQHLMASLHGTTAGHLSDGYYEMGLSPRKGSRFSVFPQADAPVPGGRVKSLSQPPPFLERADQGLLATHYSDLPRKECMQCHLWSEGRAVRGRVGFDGDYRGAGCAACHVLYATNGLSRSEDSTIPKEEPGHPIAHRMTRSPTTDTCTSCHYGDASIGLQFRGLSQLPPNSPTGPQVAGTTDRQLNRAFYLNDPSIVPPDVHHEKGMHCIDCHTIGDVMGDGKLHGQMEHAVEISCTACHGTFEHISELRTERGTPLEHLSWDGEKVVLTSKVDGAQHVVPQVVHVLSPDHPAYNRHAAEAMTAPHASIECYACHSAWNANFLGFHFSRREQLTQLDLLSGKKTPGRVTTQEKVFATWKSFYAGLDEKGFVAPYLTGFSTMGSVWDENGQLLLDQVMPETAAGLSGMSMIHHQPHSIRPTARSCVECHRAPGTWGLGTANFRLARTLAFVADRRGVEIVAVDRRDFPGSLALGKIPIPDTTDIVLRCDPIQGHADRVFVAEGGHGIHVIDVRDPTAPKRIGFHATVDPRGLELVGDWLFVADGGAGLKILDVGGPGQPVELGRVATFDARDVDVRWPWAYVADGPGGLAVLDVSDPRSPACLSLVDLGGGAAIGVESLFQYSRPVAKAGLPEDRRTRARNVAAVLDRKEGLYLVDVTEPAAAQVLFPPRLERTRATQANVTYRGLGFLSQVDLADPQGGDPTAERDYVYLLSEKGTGDMPRSTISIMDVSDPERVSRRKPPQAAAGYSTEQLVMADYYTEPTRRRIAFAVGAQGVQVADLSTSRQPVQIGNLRGLVDAYAMAVEEFPLDRTVDEQGRALKDVSHEDSRWMKREEISAVLGIGARDLGVELPVQDSEPWRIRERFLELDRDRSCGLEASELGRQGGDGSGRVGLLEFAADSGLWKEAARAPRATEIRVRLSQLLDVVSPYAHASAGKGLTKAQFQRAFFAALDLDGDERLSPDELSRHPGRWEDLRYGGAGSRTLFKSADRNGDGVLNAREFTVEDEIWHALDQDGDGVLRLVEAESEGARKRGLVLPGSEWPGSRTNFAVLPPGITVEAMLARFDQDGDEVLERRELGARVDLLPAADGDRDGRLSRAELARFLVELGKEGVHAAPDDFLGRWDLDGSGAVEDGELTEAARAAIRSRK